MSVLVALHIPDGSRQGKTVWIDPTESAPTTFSIGATLAHNFAPTTETDYTQLALAQSCANPARPWRGTGALVGYQESVSSDLSHIAPQQNGLKKELKQAREALSEKSQELARLDDVLAPVRIHENSIRLRLRNTHFIFAGRYPRRWDYAKGPPPLDCITPNLGRASERKSMFSELDNIAREWGPMKTVRRAADRQVKWLGREITAIEKRLKKETAKKAKGTRHAQT